MYELKTIILSDAKIESSELIRFVLICLRETGGIRRVSENLKKAGEVKICEDAYPLLDLAKSRAELNLDGYDKTQLIKICKSITDTLTECRDLKTLTCYSEEEVKELLGKISTL